MSKNRWLIVLGLMVAVTPFLGFPLKFKDLLLVILGLLIVLFAFRITKIKSVPETDNGVFVDSKQSELEENEEIEKNEDDNTQKLLDDQENQ